MVVIASPLGAAIRPYVAREETAVINNPTRDAAAFSGYGRDVVGRIASESGGAA